LRTIKELKLDEIIRSDTQTSSSDELLTIIISKKTEYNEFFESISYIIEKVKFHNYTDKEINVKVHSPSPSPRQRQENNGVVYDKLQEDYGNLQSRESCDIVLTTDENSYKSRDESKVFMSVN
jgi:hypothetical protein